MVVRILQIILPVFVIVAGGWVYGRLRGTEIGGLNRLNMDVFTPALILGALSSRSFDLSANAGLVAGALLAGLLMHLLRKTFD